MRQVLLSRRHTKANIYEIKGDLEAWRSKIALPIVPYPLLCLGVLLGFAPPLLGVFRTRYVWCTYMG